MFLGPTSDVLGLSSFPTHHISPWKHGPTAYHTLLLPKKGFQCISKKKKFWEIEVLFVEVLDFLGSYTVRFCNNGIHKLELDHSRMLIMHLSTANEDYAWMERLFFPFLSFPAVLILRTDSTVCFIF